MPLKLIIFDLDGTLVDTARDIAEALNHAIRPLGLRELGVEEVKALVGEGTTRLIEKALAPLGEEADDEAKGSVLQSFLDYYSGHLSMHSALYPEVKETLWKLSAFKKAVLSNKREELSRRLLEDLGIAGAFTLIAGSDTAGARKPSPEAVRYVLEAVGAEASETLMVGDSPYDVEAAAGAGVKTVAVTYGYRDRSLLKEAARTIDSLDALLPVLLEMSAISEKRRESRFTVSPACRKYIVVNVKHESSFATANLLDISRRGLMFRGPARFKRGEAFECEVSIPGSLSRTVGIKGTVRHCERFMEDERHGGDYYCGVEIKEVSSELWFRVFGKICDFISEREGKVF